MTEEQEREDFDLGIPFEEDDQGSAHSASLEADLQSSDLLQKSSEDTIIELSVSDEVDSESRHVSGPSMEADDDSDGYQPVAHEANSGNPQETAPEYAQLSLKLDTLSAQIQSLEDHFKGKLKYDSHKEKLIDALHKELQDYKNDPIKKHVHSIIIDIIKVVDDVRKLSQHYRSLPLAERDPEKIMEIIDKILSDLEDLFLFQGVKPYVCQDKEYDPKRQRVMKRIRTDDPLKDKTVAESIRPGYEWDGKVIRPEMVGVYLYQETGIEEDTRSNDE